MQACISPVPHRSPTVSAFPEGLKGVTPSQNGDCNKLHLPFPIHFRPQLLQRGPNMNRVSQSVLGVISLGSQRMSFRTLSKVFAVAFLSLCSAVAAGQSMYSTM